MNACPPALRTRSGRNAAFAVALLATIGGCDDRDTARATADTALARDLALAGTIASPMQPEYNDAPVAEETEPARVEQQAAPVRAPRRDAGASQRAARRQSPMPPEPRVRTPGPEARAEPESAGAMPAPPPAPAPARAEAAGFAAGTQLALTIGARVCTVSGRPGDKLVARLREPVHGSGGAMIPAGATIVLEVASVEPGDPPESGRITFRVRSLDIDERAHAARGSGASSGRLDRAQVPRVNASDRKKVVTGAIAGAILGRVLGGDTRGAVIGAAAGGAAGAVSAKGDQRFEGCLPAGSPIAITLDEALAIS